MKCLSGKRLYGAKGPEHHGLNGVIAIQNSFMLRLAKEDEETKLGGYRMQMGNGRRIKRMLKHYPQVFRGYLQVRSTFEFRYKFECHKPKGISGDE